MSELLVWKKKMQEFYAKHSVAVDRGTRFVLALVSFLLINQKIGVYKMAASPLVSLGMALIATFLPPIATVLMAAALILVHLYFISIGVMAVCAMIFLVMFIFYCRFTPEKALILLVTPLAFWMNIPYAVPIVCALAFTPVTAVPVAFGTIIHFMLKCVETSSTALASAEGMIGQITLFVKAVFTDKAMWVTLFSFILCVLVVYCVRRREIDHAWKIAIASGAVVNLLVIGCGCTLVNSKVSFVALILGNIVAIAVGIILELFLFSVDYSRSEHLQFEDDEYYYYVKAIPKVSIAAPEKTVKTINERKTTEEDSDEIQRIAHSRSEAGEPVKKKVKKVKKAKTVKKVRKSVDTEGKAEEE